MTKYSINTKGEILEEKKINNNIFFENKTFEISSILNQENKSSIKPSDDFDLLITRKYLDLDLSSVYSLILSLGNFINPNSKNIEDSHIFKKSFINTNKSFNFFKKDNNGRIIEKKEEEFEKVKTYSDYNSFLDLDNNLILSKKVFAEELDIYGIPLFLKDPLQAGKDIILKILTLFDMILASVIPVTMISILQMLIQSNQDSSFNKQKMELGKYISYSTGNETIDMFVILILERSLNAIERLMHYPKFKSKISLSNAFDDIGYFILGYMMYLNPGANIDLLKKESKNDISTLNSSETISDILTTLISSDSFSHPFNLLIRKIVKSNNFLKNSSSSTSRITKNGENEIGSISRNLSYMGNYFYKFIGERVAVGEKLFSIERNSNKRTKNINELFSKTRIKDLKQIEDVYNVDTVRSNILLATKEQDKNFYEKSLYEKNTSITSFRNSTDFILSNALEENSFIKSKKALSDRLLNTTKLDTQMRLPSSYVTEIESKINSEYMPFSFHDLRTNDVFRFHAFIESVSDNFTPNYSDSTGFSRMDPVKIYTTTTRSISLSFWLISTSKEDHDDMWFYINRMIACVYPQWSKPKTTHPSNSEKITFKFKEKDITDVKFGIPFTQIPVASPMIRLRVGDILKSNYSEKSFFENILGIKYDHHKNKSKNKKIIDFMNNDAVAITKNYKKTEGNGIAGFIRSLNVINDSNVNWEIDEGSKAPIAIKIDIQFDPIHDIPLGLNYKGLLRSSAYNVGSNNSNTKKLLNIIPDSEN